MERELRPCPFCGAAAGLFSHEMDERTTLWWVQCRNTHCLARRRVVDSRRAAVDEWNSRKGV